MPLGNKNGDNSLDAIHAQQLMTNCPQLPVSIFGASPVLGVLGLNRAAMYARSFLISRQPPADRRLSVITGRCSIDFAVRDFSCLSHNLWIGDIEIHQPGLRNPAFQPGRYRRRLDAEYLRGSHGPAQPVNHCSGQRVVFRGVVSFLSHA